MKVLVSNIQRCCLMDGPGIRTTVFTMGCKYRCPWCCNPENLTHGIKSGLKTKHVYGRMITCDDLVDEILKDKKFYSFDGGVTFSGGEFLLSAKEYEEVLRKLKNQGIHICVETSLNANLDDFILVSKFTDLFIIDFKIVNDKLSEMILKDSSKDFISNFEYLVDSLVDKDYIARIPLAKEIITKDNLSAIKEMFLKKKPLKIEIFKLHNLGNSKYNDLNMKLDYDFVASDKEVNYVLDFFKDINVAITEIKI